MMSCVGMSVFSLVFEPAIPYDSPREIHPVLSGHAQQRPDRAMIRLEWIEQAVEHPGKEVVQ